VGPVQNVILALVARIHVFAHLQATVAAVEEDGVDARDERERDDREGTLHRALCPSLPVRPRHRARTSCPPSAAPAA
jgi:hypothetical protein